uniref:NR LBD domain-containing protein n=1 Tax=Syphacia muris TaxID=451379 RepID=A0A0N5AAH7_9BILA
MQSYKSLFTVLSLLFTSLSIRYSTYVEQQFLQITPTGEHIASLSDSLFDWRRCFLFYIDFLKRFSDFITMPYQDQIKIAKRRFSPFHWWLVSNWSAQCNCMGVCYSNGTFFPLETSQQFFPDLRGTAEAMYTTLLRPLQELQPDLAEQCILFAILIFADDVKDLLPTTQLHSKQMRDRYIKALYQHIRQRDSNKSSAEIAYRISRLMLLIPSITVSL